MTLHSYRAPWIVGRTALLEHAAEDFLNEVTRQTPWRKARFEALLDRLGEHLGDPVPLADVTAGRLAAWHAALPAGDQADAAELIGAFQAYLLDWGWVPRPAQD